MDYDYFTWTAPNGDPLLYRKPTSLFGGDKEIAVLRGDLGWEPVPEPEKAVRRGLLPMKEIADEEARMILRKRHPKLSEVRVAEIVPFERPGVKEGLVCPICGRTAMRRPRAVFPLYRCRKCGAIPPGRFPAPIRIRFAIRAAMVLGLGFGALALVAYVFLSIARNRP